MDLLHMENEAIFFDERAPDTVIHDGISIVPHRGQPWEEAAQAFREPYQGEPGLGNPLPA